MFNCEFLRICAGISFHTYNYNTDLGIVNLRRPLIENKFQVEMFPFSMNLLASSSQIQTKLPRSLHFLQINASRD